MFIFSFPLDIIWPYSRLSYLNIRTLWTRFGNYYFPTSFAFCACSYFDLDPNGIIGKYLFISVGMTTRHGFKVLIYLVWFVYHMFMLYGWRQPFLESSIFEWSKSFAKTLCLFCFESFVFCVHDCHNFH